MKFKRLLLLLVFAVFPSFAAYQQQGFDQFQELDGNMNFTCTWQCLALIGPLAGSDYAMLKWAFQWNGVVGYGFLVGQQIAPGENFQVNGAASVDQKFSFSALPFFSQIPAEAQLILVVQWNITWVQISLQPGLMDFYQKIGQWWKSFWTFDTFKPYTINLLYWPMISGKNANALFYRIFLLIVIAVFAFTKYSFQKKLLYVLLWGLSLWLIYDVRMWLESINNYHNDYTTYISQSWYQKTYRERGDFYSFVDFTKDTLSQLWISDTEQIIFYTDNAWPFPGSMKYFLYPYDVQVNSGKSNCYVVYGSQFAVKNNDHLLYSWVDIWSWTFYNFSPNAFIFVK